MNEHLEDALDTYLGEKELRKGNSQDLLSLTSPSAVSKPIEIGLVIQSKKDGFPHPYVFQLRNLKLWGMEK